MKAVFDRRGLWPNRSGGAEYSNVIRHTADLGFGHIWEHGQAELARGQSFSRREVALVMAQFRVGWLKVDRHGIVNATLNSVFAQMIAQGISLGMLDGVYVPDGVGPVGRRGTRQLGNAVQVFPVGFGNPATPGIPAVEVLELDSENSCLDALHPIIEAQFDMIVPA